MKSWIAGFTLLISIPSFAQTLPVKGTALTLPPKQFTPDSTKMEVPPARLADRPTFQLAGKSLFVMSAASSLGIATFGFVDEPLRKYTLAHRNEETFEITQYITPFGNSKYMIPASAAIYVTGLSLRNPKMQRAGILITSSLLLNDLVTKKLKDEFQRSRPDEAEHNYYFAGGEGGRHHLSFPSAHTSTAFAFATSVATIYGDHKWVPPVAYSAATLVGLSRIHDNKHWATDVMAGAAVGFLTARATNILLQQTEKELARHKINIYVSPRVSSGSAGLHLGATF